MAILLCQFGNETNTFAPGRTDFEKLDAILQVSANSGYSIPNVHQRVQLLFGADYGLSYGRSPSGTTASLHLPIEQPGV